MSKIVKIFVELLFQIVNFSIGMISNKFASVLSG